MSEYRSEHRVELDGIASVSIFNPVGRVEVTGWKESFLSLDMTVKSSLETLSAEHFQPVINRSGDMLTICPPVQAAGDDSDLKSFSFEFDSDQVKEDIESAQEDIRQAQEDVQGAAADIAGGLSDFIGNIVHFAQKSIHGAGSGTHVSMVIRMPETMPVRVKNLNGIISITAMKNSVRARGMNGPVTVSGVSGPLVAQTVNGPVTVDRCRCPDITLKSVNGPVKCYLEAVDGPVTLKTVNGPIRMMVPPSADLELSAHTLHGAMKIGSEFTSNLRTSRKIRSALNAGTHSVVIKTTTGAITVFTADNQPAKVPSSPVPPARPAAPVPPQPPVRPVSTAKEAPLPVPPATGASQSADETRPQAGVAASKIAESDQSLESQINRMLMSGKITPEEAARLRQAI